MTHRYPGRRRTGDERLADALRAEHAAIFGYGPAGARLDGPALELVKASEAAHRARRDALVLRLTARSAPVPAAEPAYALPFPVTDRAAALRLAVALEERAAAVWRQVLPETSGEARALALDALTDCALRAVRFRATAGVTPVTTALPGAPS